MIKKISIFLLIIGICLLGYILYVLCILKGSVDPELSSLAILTTLCGGLLLKARSPEVQNKIWREIKMLLFFLGALISLIFLAANIVKGNFGENNYHSMLFALSFWTCSFKGWNYYTEIPLE